MIARVMHMDEHKKARIKLLILAIVIPLAVGGLAAILTAGDMQLFSQLKKPPLSPPGWLFPVAWTILYAMMGYASFIVYTSDVSKARKRRALIVYAAQLAVNFLWPIVFFSGQMYLAAFAVLTLLWLLILACMILFYYISNAAGELLIPYMLWVSYAAYLNLSIYFLNG